MEDEESAVCLYCMVAGASHHVIAHMRDIHEFDIRKIKSDLKLTFYQQVKLVNYIRRQVGMLNFNKEKQQVFRSGHKMEDAQRIGY